MALTSTYTTISSTQTASNKPLDTVLMDAMRQDIDVLYEWLGGPTYTPSTSHNHNGVNSALLSGNSGASLVLLSSASGSASASINIVSNITTSYDTYIIDMIDLVPTNDGDHLYGRISVSTVFQSTAGDYTYYSEGLGASSWSVSSGDAQLYIAQANGNAAGESLNGQIRFNTPASTSYKKRFYWNGMQTHYLAGAINNFRGGGSYNIVANIVDGFQVLFHTGTVASGKLRLYGLKKS